MTSRPRQSVLKLFDPLSTPTRNTSSGLSKENATPRNTRAQGKEEGVSETVFFKRTYSRSKEDSSVPPIPPLPKEFARAKESCLIEVEDGVETDLGTTRKPLCEIGGAGYGNTASVTGSTLEGLQGTVISFISDPQSYSQDSGKTSERSELKLSLPNDEASPDELEEPDISMTPADCLTGHTITPSSSHTQPESHPLVSSPFQPASLPETSPLPDASSNSLTPSRSDEHLPAVSDGPICFFLPDKEEPAHSQSDVPQQKSAPGLSIRRSSFDLHSSWKLRAQNTSVDLINDEVSFLSGMDDSSFLDQSREVKYISRFGGHVVNGDCAELDQNASEITPDTSVDSNSQDKTIANAPEGLKASVPQRTPSPTVLGKRATPPRSPSPILETPKSSPISRSIAMAPTKKEAVLRYMTHPEQSSEASNPCPTNTVQDETATISVSAETKLTRIQPLAIKKKHKPSASIDLDSTDKSASLPPRPPMAQSTSTSDINIKQRRLSVSRAPSAGASSVKPKLPPGRGGARRVPLNSSAAAPLMKPTKTEALAQSIRKGPQRPPVPIPLVSSSKVVPTQKVATKPTGAGEKAVSVKQTATAAASSSTSGPSGGISRLPKPQIKSRIPGPSAGFRRNPQ